MHMGKDSLPVVAKLHPKNNYGGFPDIPTNGIGR